MAEKKTTKDDEAENATSEEEKERVRAIQDVTGPFQDKSAKQQSKLGK